MVATIMPSEASINSAMLAGQVDYPTQRFRRHDSAEQRTDHDVTNARERQRQPASGGRAMPRLATARTEPDTSPAGRPKKNERQAAGEREGQRFDGLDQSAA